MNNVRNPTSVMRTARFAALPFLTAGVVACFIELIWRAPTGVPMPLILTGSAFVMIANLARSTGNTLQIYEARIQSLERRLADRASGT